MKKFIFGLLVSVCCHDAIAELRAVAFPKTVEDVPFAERVENERAGYEPYKDLQAYHGLDITKQQPTGSGGKINVDGTTTGGAGSGESAPSAPSGQYILVQCRAKSSRMNSYLSGGNKNEARDAVLEYAPYTNVVGAAAVMAMDDKPTHGINDDLRSAASRYVSWDFLLGKKGLDCGRNTYNAYDKCFTPCQKSGTTDSGAINKELSGIINPFCACNWGSKGYVFQFSNPDAPQENRLYSKAEVDQVITRLNAHGHYDECSTRTTWYVIAFNIDANDGKKIKYYRHIEIGD